MKKLCSRFPAGNRKKNCITPAYLPDQQFSGQKITFFSREEQPLVKSFWAEKVILQFLFRQAEP